MLAMLSSIAVVGLSGRITLWRDYDSTYQLPQLREFCNTVLRRGAPDDLAPVVKWKDIAVSCQSVPRFIAWA